MTATDAPGPIRGNLSDFWHGSDPVPETAYDALRVWIFHCSECEVNLPEGEHWPKRCRKGHLNLKNQTPAYLTFHCRKCGINLPETDRWPVRCAQGHLNDARPG